MALAVRASCAASAARSEASVAIRTAPWADSAIAMATVPCTRLISASTSAAEVWAAALAEAAACAATSAARALSRPTADGAVPSPLCDGSG